MLFYSPFLLPSFLGGKRKRVRNNQLSYQTWFIRNSPITQNPVWRPRVEFLCDSSLNVSAIESFNKMNVQKELCSFFVRCRRTYFLKFQKHCFSSSHTQYVWICTIDILYNRETIPFIRISLLAESLYTLSWLAENVE